MKGFNGLCTCTACGWAHMAVTREHAEAEVARFNAFLFAQSTDVQDMYGGTASVIIDYELCFNCGKSEFRAFREGDCPDGVTLAPVIWEG